MSATGEFRTPLENLYIAVSPANIIGMLTCVLMFEDLRFREGIVRHKGERRGIRAGEIRQDQSIELSVILEDTAPVQTDDAVYPVDNRVGTDDILTVQHNRPVAGHNPFLKGLSLSQKGVAGSKLVRRVLLQRL